MRRFLFAKLHPSWSFYALTFGLISGVILSLSLHISSDYLFFWLLLAIVAFILSLLQPSRFMLTFAFVAGLIFGSWRTLPHQTSQDFFLENSGQTITLSGTISDNPDFSAGKNVIHLQHLCLESTASSEKPCFAGTAYVKLSRPIEAARSDQVTLTGKLGDGFGTFVTSLFRPTVVAIVKASPGDIFAQLKQTFSEHILDFIPSPEVDLGLGYLMGMKSGLSDDFSEALRAVGMTHVIVASGAHLGILVGAAKKIFGRISKFAELLFSLLLIIFFVLVVGFTPSMTRAGLVSALSLLFGYVGRVFTPWRLLSFVAMLTLLIEPINFLSLGWQLSFASFFGILILAPRLSNFLYGGKTPPWLASMLITSFSTCLICAPILIYNFGSISLLSFVANLFILPTLPYAMLLVFLVGCASFILPSLASLLSHPAIWLLDFHIGLVNFLAEKTVFIINLPVSDPRFFLLYLPVALALFWPVLRRFSRRRKARPRPLSAKSRELCYNKEYEN